MVSTDNKLAEWGIMSKTLNHPFQPCSFRLLEESQCKSALVQQESCSQSSWPKACVTLTGCGAGPTLYDSARLTAETRVAQGYSSIVRSLWALFGTWSYRWLVSRPRRANFLNATLLLSRPVKLGWRLLIWTADSTVAQHEAIKGIIIAIVFVIKCCVNTKRSIQGGGGEGGGPLRWKPTVDFIHPMSKFCLVSFFCFFI